MLKALSKQQTEKLEIISTHNTEAYTIHKLRYIEA